MAITTLKAKWQTLMKEFPAPVKTFLKRAVMIFVLWKLAYIFFLADARILDGPLTRLVARQTVFLMNGFSSTGHYHQHDSKANVVDADGVSHDNQGSVVMYEQWNLVGIGDPCNGLQLLVLYLGFILAMPVPWKRKLMFSVGGLVGIHLINVVRCAGLAFWTMHWRSSFDFAHHYLFKAVVYSAIFVLWAWYSKKLNLADSVEPATN